MPRLAPQFYSALRSALLVHWVGRRIFTETSSDQVLYKSCPGVIHGKERGVVLHASANIGSDR